MSMGAIKQFTDNVSEAVLAVNAGNDIILTSDYYMHYDAVMKAFKSGQITEDTINKACRRILAWKLKYLYATNNPNIDEDKDKDKGNKNNTVLIAVLVVLGVVIIFGGLIAFFIIKRKRESIPKVDKLDGENMDVGITQPLNSS